MYNINLLPPNLRKDRKKKVKIQMPTYSLLLILLVLIIAGTSKVLIDTKLEENETLKNELFNEYTVLNEELNRNNSKEVNNIKEAKLEQLLVQIQSIKGKQYLWFNVLNKISKVTPATVTIEKIEETQEKNPDSENIEDFIKIYGLTYSFEDLKIIEDSFNSVFTNVYLLNYENNSSTILERAKFNLGKQQGIDVGAKEKIGNKISFAFIFKDTENQPVFIEQNNNLMDSSTEPPINNSENPDGI